MEVVSLVVTAAAAPVMARLVSWSVNWPQTYFLQAAARTSHRNHKTTTAAHRKTSLTTAA